MNTYEIKISDLLLDSSPVQKSYILKLRDLPHEGRPREKMLKIGARALSTTELVAVILGTGTKKEDLLSMSGRIIREYGERSLASAIDPNVMSADLQIPLVKAMQIVACAELGKRFFKRSRGGIESVRTARDVFEYLKDMRPLGKEHLRGLYLDHHYRIIHDEVISIGTIDTNIVHPREVFKPALEYSAVAIILAHNHPSGNAKPSAADIAITKQLVESGKLMGIQLLDHVIITEGGAWSINVSYE